MIIRFIKAKHTDKTDRLVCLRADGSSTWMKESSHFIEHDLVHFVVETTFGFQNAFYGLVASGWDIPDFGQIDPATGQKPALPAEAGQVEFIVQLLQRELWDGQVDENFQATLAVAIETRSKGALPAPPRLPQAQLDQARRRIRELLHRWAALPPGQSLALTFPE